MKGTIRQEIVTAIIEGFEGHALAEEHTGDAEDCTLIYVDGFTEPITVLTDDVLVPDEFGDAASGIALDVDTILAFAGDEDDDASAT